MASQETKPGFSLKDHLFNRERVAYLASCFSTVDSNFDSQGFVRTVMRGFKDLELKQRIVKIATVLENYLHPDFRKAVRQIVSALPPALDPTLRDDDFGDFIFAPLGEFVVRQGLAGPHVSDALRTLQQVTMRFSMEDAIRYFIRTHPEQTLAELARWSTDKHYHVRRLVSEGTRPLLPWSGRLSLPTHTTLPLLDTLHADPTRYVTRSVANHLNDLTKSEPDIVLETLQRWQVWGRQSEPELRWMTRHALRTLIKRGDPHALALLGFRAEPAIAVSEFCLKSTRTRPGEALEFSFVVTARRAESLVLDYVIEFVKANGRRAPKVFKIKQVDLQPGQPLRVTKRHPFRAEATTFKLNPGTHRLTLQINGQAQGSCDFEMV
jgi:3-methyladenine DNA glycosylase AlkC